jgi:hypothetical protein
VGGVLCGFASVGSSGFGFAHARRNASALLGHEDRPRPGREVASVGAGASGLDGPVFPTSCARAGLLVAAAREGRVAVWGAPCSEACRRGHCPAASLFLPPPTTTATRLSVASGCQEPAAREAAGALLSPPRRPGKRKTLEERQWRGRPAQNYFNLFFDGSGVGNRSINLTQLLPVWCITSNHRCAERRFRGPIEQGATCIHHYRRPALERGNTKPKKTIP